MTLRFENSHGKRAKECAEEMEQQSQEFCRSFDLVSNQMSRGYLLLKPLRIYDALRQFATMHLFSMELEIDERCEVRRGSGSMRLSGVR